MNQCSQDISTRYVVAGGGSAAAPLRPPGGPAPAPRSGQPAFLARAAPRSWKTLHRFGLQAHGQPVPGIRSASRKALQDPAPLRPQLRCPAFFLPVATDAHPSALRAHTVAVNSARSSRPPFSSSTTSRRPASRMCSRSRTYPRRRRGRHSATAPAWVKKVCSRGRANTCTQLEPRITGCVSDSGWPARTVPRFFGDFFRIVAALGIATFRSMPH